MPEKSLQNLYGNRVRVRVCGLLEKEGCLLLALHNGVGPLGSLWVPPGGGLEFGETLEQTLVREFEEECCLQVKVGKFFNFYEFLEPPLQAIEMFFFVEHVAGTATLGHDPEGLNVGGIPVLSALQWFTPGEILATDSLMVHRAAVAWAKSAT